MFADLFSSLAYGSGPDLFGSRSDAEAFVDQVSIVCFA